jgi:hypothetical protein
MNNLTQSGRGRMKKIDDYVVGDIVDIDDVNFIKNKAYEKAFNLNLDDLRSGKLKWEKVKREIKKRITFKIVSI